MSASFSPYFERSEEIAVQALLSGFDWPDERAEAVQKQAARFVKAVRARDVGAGQLESFLKEYALDTEEGLALMTLAEALLRVPDKATAQALIRDKVAAANWLERSGDAKDWVVKAAGVGLFMTSKTLDSVLSRFGEPVIREAMVKAMQILGRQFVLGPDIEAAIKNARPLQEQGYRMSYDILGEGARTAADAQGYFESYAAAIDVIAAHVPKDAARRPGLSVKLSALHPRYEFAHRERCVPEMGERLLALAKKAADHDLALTVDAEECARLNLSIEIIEWVMGDPSLRWWDGFGMAVQAYHKAAPAVIDHILEQAKAQQRRIQMRLVKGAYWDTEIKLAQVNGLIDFPVYTRKAHSDASYIACAAKMLAAGDRVYPMFGTHNAHSMAAVQEMARHYGGAYEFQRLFGMGDALFVCALEDGAAASIYAPVGPHKDLLPYLVRRLLENGANSSFVNRILDSDVSVDTLVSDPVDKSKKQPVYKHPKIQLPEELYAAERPQGRANARGLDLSAPETELGFVQALQDYQKLYEAAPLIGGQVYKQSLARSVINPANFEDKIGVVYDASPAQVEEAYDKAKAAFAGWAGSDAVLRADILQKAADALEARRDEFMALLVREGGKTWRDVLAEVREAVDFLRYYAGQGAELFHTGGVKLPGPTGERNHISLHGRGVFVCISPWNFPLAIFTGQIAAALIAGNCVLAKPAEQTPLVAMLMVQLLHDAGVDTGALQLLPGDGRIGALLVQHEDNAGVAFTGSTGVAQEINKALARKNGPIVPLIAETGGQNAMIVDSSALPEQVIDDVILSAFGSAGQRCSALRVLYVQDDVADKMIAMLRGAMQEITLGEPCFLSSDVGPVIDEEALAMLRRHRENLSGFGKTIYEVPIDSALSQRGHYFGPCAYEILSISALDKEVFGPILHVVRYERSKIDDVLEEIRNTGYGLTLGIHSRIKSFCDYVCAQMPVGNIYVNRSIIGAVVGTQPFGGMGLSGTGPKAGGPHYLQRFAHERVISVNTTAAGGNASLVSLAE